jgi:CBS domain-containing membrane protein
MKRKNASANQRAFDGRGEDPEGERQFRPLARRFRLAGLVLVNTFVAIAVPAALAMALRTPLVFPSLGPTAFLLFFAPELPTASPRNTLCGHAIGIACGCAALYLTGLQHAPLAMQEGVGGARIVAAALSMALTGALMILFDVVHSPAGATTLIISLGIISQPTHLLGMEAAIALIVVLALITHRLREVAYPLRSPRNTRTSGCPERSAENDRR